MVKIDYQKFFSLIFISIFVFSLQTAYGLELTPIPEKEIFGPNDPIRILLELEGYAGQNIEWIAHKPDGAEERGFLQGINSQEENHRISRNAADGQFGEWSVDYIYDDITKTIKFQVEPLLLEVTTDKYTYNIDEILHATITTNYFEPKAAIAHFFFINLFDFEGDLANSRDESTIKASSSATSVEFEIDEISENNHLGKYSLSVQYFGKQTSVDFVIADKERKVLLFVETSKELYFYGETVIFVIQVPDYANSYFIDSDVTLKIIDPSGKTIEKNIILTDQMARVTFEDGLTNLPGTYLVQVEYAGATGSTKFSVEWETLGDEEIIKDVTPRNTNKIVIPQWIKNNAGWWADGKITDLDFITGIQFMVKNQLIIVPETHQINNGMTKEIPSWLKNNAGWWAKGSIDDTSFSAGIQYLIQHEIIKI